MNSAEGATRRRCRLLQKINPTTTSVRRTSPPTTPPAIAPAFLLECDVCPVSVPELPEVLLGSTAVIVDVIIISWSELDVAVGIVSVAEPLVVPVWVDGSED